MKELKLQLFDAATGCDWSIDFDGKDIIFQRFSDLGQDFFFTLVDDNNTPQELADQLERHIDNYDPITEAMLWVGPDGHGKNGAPDDPRDIIADMEGCKGMMLSLLSMWRVILSFGGKGYEEILWGKRYTYELGGQKVRGTEFYFDSGRCVLKCRNPYKAMRKTHITYVNGVRCLIVMEGA